MEPKPLVKANSSLSYFCLGQLHLKDDVFRGDLSRFFNDLTTNTLAAASFLYCEMFPKGKIG